MTKLRKTPFQNHNTDKNTKSQILSFVLQHECVVLGNEDKQIQNILKLQLPPCTEKFYNLFYEILSCFS